MIRRTRWLVAALALAAIGCGRPPILLDAVKTRALALEDEDHRRVALFRIAVGYARVGRADQALELAEAAMRPRQIHLLVEALAIGGGCAEALEVGRQNAQPRRSFRSALTRCTRVDRLDRDALEDQAGALAPGDRLWTLLTLARMAHDRGEPDRTGRLLSAARRLGDEQLDRIGAQAAVMAAALDVGAVERAREVADEALHLTESLPPKSRTQALRQIVARLARDPAGVERMGRATGLLLEAFEQSANALERMDDLLAAAQGLAAVGDSAGAERLADAAAELRATIAGSIHAFRTANVEMPRWALAREADARARLGQIELAKGLASRIEEARWRPFALLRIGLAEALGPKDTLRFWSQTRIFAAVGVRHGIDEGRARAAAWLAEEGRCEDTLHALEPIEHGPEIVTLVAEPIIACAPAVPALSELGARWARAARRMYQSKIVGILAACGEVGEATRMAESQRTERARISLLTDLAIVVDGRKAQGMRSAEKSR